MLHSGIWWLCLDLPTRFLHCVIVNNMYFQVSLDHHHSKVVLPHSMHLEGSQQLPLRMLLTHLQRPHHSLLNKPSQGLQHLAPHPSNNRNLQHNRNHKQICLMLLGLRRHPLEGSMPLVLQHHQVSSNV